MRITCIECNKVFESLLIPQEKAWHDTHEKLMQHVAVDHKELFKKLRATTLNAQMAIGAYLAITQVTKVDEENIWLVSRMEKLVDTIMLAIGYEPEKDTDEEEEEEEDEQEDEKQDEPLEELPGKKETDKQEVN